MKKLSAVNECHFSAHGGSNRPLLHVNAGEALSHASDLLHVAKLLAEDAAMIRNTDRDAWASCYLQDMSKAVIDVVKVLEAPGSHCAWVLS
ncbi:DUF3077 domain-containing protein [Pseudomonas sp. B21-054]|uniref:DUF3077 domain-containing protein n=1 Tax=Pseudomonas sp. B21-054 TaxID=2895494 RepID=UPI00222ECA80|nr:DUF3077 domain-containing protein [Pseudomonas sp. B21-054]UZE18299.1 DUF3077 domain-containing protein [Pseudomonas sp. B21-054]